MQPGSTGPSAYPGGYPQQPPGGPRPYPDEVQQQGHYPAPGYPQQPYEPQPYGQHPYAQQPGEPQTFEPQFGEPQPYAQQPGEPLPYGQQVYEQPPEGDGPFAYPPQPPLGGAGPQRAPERAKPPYSALRGTVAGLCLVLTVLLAVPAVGALWLKQTLISDSGFTDVATKLIDNADVRAEVASKITGEITARAPGIAQDPAVARQIAQAVDQVVATPQFRELWRSGVSQAHHIVTSVLLGKNDAAVSTADGKQFTVHLQTPVDQIVAQLVPYGVHLDPAALPKDLPIDLARVPSSGPAQNAARTIDSAGWAVPTLTLALLLLGLAVAVNRIRAVILTSLGCLVAGAVLLLTVTLGRSPVVDNARQASSSLTPSATGAIYDVFTDSLVTSGQILLGVSAGVLVLASVAGVVLRRRRADRALT